MAKTRTGSDLIGELQVPADALYDVQTQRCLDNFNISHFHLNEYPLYLKGIAVTKMGAAIANHELGLISDEVFEGIMRACREISEGKHAEAFPIDMIQGGAGTSTNMNANEVIANLCLGYNGYELGDFHHCWPNDDVNRSQSTNDAYPTAAHLGLYYTHLELVKHLKKLIDSFRTKGREFAGILKMGRTQLEDAVPMSLGQSFDAFASILEDEIKHLDEAAADFLVINMGGTAIGTGICSEPGYAEKCTRAIAEITGWEVSLSSDLIAASSDTSSLVGYSGALKRLAVKASKISNDLRLIASGPRCGFGEVNLPEKQPGSSIMPGKVNPVIPEVMSQICFKVIGNDTCVTMSGEAAQMELNAMEPVMIQCCFESAELLMNGFDTLRVNCIDGITANAERCENYIKNSIGIVTALNPIIGYKHSTAIAKKAKESGRGVYELVLEEGILSKEELDTILKPENMIRPVKLDIKPRK